MTIQLFTSKHINKAFFIYILLMNKIAEKCHIHSLNCHHIRNRRRRSRRSNWRRRRRRRKRRSHPEVQTSREKVNRR